MPSVRIIAYADSTVVSGAERVFVRAVSDLARDPDIRVDLAGSPPVIDHAGSSDAAIETTIEVPGQRTRLAALALVDPGRRRLVRRALSGRAWDVALVNLPSAEYGATPLADGVLGGTPTVGLLHVHQALSTLPFRFGGLRERLAGGALRRATRVCVLSSWAANQVSEDWRIPPGSIDVMPMLEPAIEPVASGVARAELGLPEGQLVGIAGRVSFAQKGHDVLLRAAEEYRDPASGPDPRFVVAGDGPDVALLRREIARRRLEDRFLVLGPVTSIDAFLSAVDGIVIPSRFEGLPLVALEALWAGTPGVASRIDGLAQIWPERWLVEPDDPHALALCLRSLLSTPPAERATVVAGARARVAASTTDDLSPFFRAVLRRAAAERGS
jgi:glycosyltransferase involved in cell wall biosynthesis